MREALERKRARGELPEQHLDRLLRAFESPVNFVPPEPGTTSYLRLGQCVQIHCPEIMDMSHLFDGQQACPDLPTPPTKYGLVLTATVSHLEASMGRENIGPGCALACSPCRKPYVKNVFRLKSTHPCCEDFDGEYLKYGQEIRFQLAHVDHTLVLRSEKPPLDGPFGPNDHNPVRLSSALDCFTKWRVVHFNRHLRFETEGSFVPPCARVVIQHVMTGECLVVENLNWHLSRLGFECGVSVHTYSDVHRNETSECIWNLLIESVEDDKKPEKPVNTCKSK